MYGENFMEPVYLCLLDCSSIQRYVFGSNKLKTNLGASHLVEKIYREWIPETLAEMFASPSAWRFADWWEKPEEILLQSRPELIMETGYVGGGNALLLFRANAGFNYAEKFIQAWTKKLLLHAPGLRPAAAWALADLNELAAGREAVFEALKMHKNTCLAATTIARHGITRECNLTGLSAEARHPFDQTVWISSEACAKLGHADEANDRLAEDYGEVLAGKFVFPGETENLGQSPEEENHLAIVHLDGNNMGDKFKACRDLVEMRRLSRSVEQATQRAMAATLRRLLEKMEVLNKEVLSWKRAGPADQAPLPVRPIILNGDDVTFVCEARLGLFLAETFLQAFAAEKAPVGEKTLPLSAGAGVAIIKTKYPFYRGYMLAEELCGSAKRLGRKDNSSWLDFHVSYRGVSTALAEIRRQKYQVGQDSLLWRPWRISTDEREEEMFSFSQLKKAVKAMAYGDGRSLPWPKSKIHALGAALAEGRQETEVFLQLARARKLILPKIAQTNAEATGWQATEHMLRTPYFDVLEAMEFYPKCLLE
jgi:hypothetical protein